MAEASRDQGSLSATDLEDDSPNMIVYRKVSLTPLAFLFEGKSWHGQAATRERGPLCQRATPAHVRRTWSMLKPAQRCLIVPVTSSRLPGLG